MGKRHSLCVSACPLFVWSEGTKMTPYGLGYYFSMGVAIGVGIVFVLLIIGYLFLRGK
jgi:hypothetical protein